MEHQPSLTVDPTRHALDILLDTRVKILELLQATPYTNLQVSVDNNFNQLINFFRHTTGTSASTPEVNSTTFFEPLNSFMGEPVHAPTAIDITLLTPSVEDTELLKQKVLQLESSIEQLDNDVIINSYALPEDELVLRGLAKKLELIDYETRPIDYDFINAIRAALVQHQPLEEQKEAIHQSVHSNTDVSSDSIETTTDSNIVSKPMASKNKKKNIN